MVELAFCCIEIIKNKSSIFYQSSLRKKGIKVKFSQNKAKKIASKINLFVHMPYIHIYKLPWSIFLTYIVG